MKQDDTVTEQIVSESGPGARRWGGRPLSVAERVEPILMAEPGERWSPGPALRNVGRTIMGALGVGLEHPSGHPGSTRYRDCREVRRRRRKAAAKARRQARLRG